MKHPFLLLVAVVELLAGGLSGAELPFVERRAQNIPAMSRAAEPKRDLVLSVQTDRTAIWVGDRIRYRVAVEHARSIQFVTDNLKASSLNLLPFEIVSLNYSEGEGGEGNRILILDLELTTYRSEPGELEIPPFSLFYFEDDAAVAASTDRAAESLTVPAVPIALRSTLPAGVAEPRDRPVVPATPWRRRIAGRMPVSLLVLSLLLAGWGLLQGRRLHSDEKELQARRALREQAVRKLRALASSDIGDESAAVRFFDALHESLRNFLAVSVAATRPGKTAAEISELPRDERADAPAAALAEIPGLLRLCDLARYAPENSGPATTRAAEARERLRALLASL